MTLVTLVPLGDIAAADIETLLDLAFGADRHARTAYRVRGNATPTATLSFAGIDDGALVGSIQCWPVRLTGDDGARHPLVMIGPVAVSPSRQRDGIGRMLMTRALAAAREHGLDQAMMLIGDPEYYGRFFGFEAGPTVGWRLPGPVERHRLLARGGAVPAVAGDLGPAA